MAGAAFRITYHKHTAEETLKSAWITADGESVADLTARCVDDGGTLYVDVTAGVDLRSGAPAVLNWIRFSTTNGTVKSSAWVADTSAVSVVTLDGYDAREENNPYVYRES